MDWCKCQKADAMKHHSQMNIRLIFLIGILATACSNDKSAKLMEDRDSYVRISEINSRYLELSNGTPFIPIGLNMVAPVGDTEKGLAQMEEWMRLLSENGGNFARIWLGHRFWNLEQNRAGEYDPEAILRIDSLFSMAGRYDIRLKLCLESFRSIHPENVGKKGRFPLTKYHVSEGGPFHTMEEYINTPEGKNHFKSKMEWFHERYGSDPLVFGWELWNEMDAIVAEGWENWTVEMLAELKTLFPENLVMQSLGSYDKREKRSMYRRINALPGNQLVQVHRYLDLGASWESCHGPMDLIASDAVREMVGFNLNKPILLAETGGVEPNHTGPLKLYAEDTAGILLHDVLFAPFFSGAAGPGHAWHWSSYIARNNLWHHFDRFAQVMEGIDPAAEDFRPGVREDEQLRTYYLDGQETVLIWIRDKKNTWESELRDKVQPVIFTGIEIELDGLDLKGANGKISIFDPWKNHWETGNIRRNKVQLPAFSRSLLIRVNK
jgi:hypothetical protein